MKVSDLKSMDVFRVVNEGAHLEEAVESCFCCDLLSIAMNKAPAGSAWVTVMANMNTLAVASLTECACIILAHDAAFDENTLKKAIDQQITVFATSLPVFDAALEVYQKIHA